MAKPIKPALEARAAEWLSCFMVLQNAKCKGQFDLNKETF